VLVALPVLLAGGCSSDTSDDRVAIAFLRSVPSSDDAIEQAFLDELAQGGYEAGSSLAVLSGGPAEVHVDAADIRSSVRSWVDDGVDLIMALSSDGAATAAEAAPAVPVLFLSNDPVARGLVVDERRPSANLTGVRYRVPGDRTLAAAAAIVEPLGRVGCLHPADDPAAEPARLDLQRGAEALGLDLLCVPFAGVDDIGTAVTELTAAGVDAVVLVHSPATVRAMPALEAALADLPVPVVANIDVEFALLVLEPDLSAVHRQLARQALRLLDGAEVRDVPVENPAEFRIVVDRGVARRLGIDIPPDRLTSAEVRD
jgi:putative tryptophan/tyrosine transport system substrate-binding protein